MSAALRISLFLVLLLLLPFTAPLVAQDDSPEKSRWERFEFHGFLSQAYARTDGEPYFGMTEDGTFNYRNIALQFRYEIAENHHFVAQLDHEALGESPIEEFRDDVQLDWGFYEYRYRRGTGAVKVGRMPTPIGIYNEIRNVGTLLPFFSPPTLQYGQTVFASESVDGVVLSNQFLPAKDWNFDLDLFVGEWEFFERDGLESNIEVARANDAVGGRLWVNTPILGLRFGGGGYTFEATDGVLRAEERDRWKLFYLSLDASFSRFWFRAEALNGQLPVALAPGFNAEAKPRVWYVQGGYDPTAKLKFAVQYEKARFNLEGPIPLPNPPSEDLGFSVRYYFLPEVLLRGEYHTAKNSFVDRDYSPISGEPVPEIDYFNISLAVSF